MNNPLNKTKIQPYSRRVAIIGVGLTPFMRVVEDESYEGLTEGELYGYAAKEAMEDAGVSPQDLDFYIHGSATPMRGSDYITPNMQVANWFGMKGKGSFHHSEACCTGYMALELACMAVASGKYDMVLSGCIDYGDSDPIEGQPATKRKTFGMDDFNESLKWIYDRTYTRPMQAGMFTVQDTLAALYAQENELTVEEMDEVLCQMAINNRYNASKNDKALLQTTFEDIAKENGFETAMEYMQSPNNPLVTEYMRISGMEERADGAGAVIVCPLEMAYKYTDQPIEVLGTGHATQESSTSHVERNGTEEAVRQVYDLTGMSGEDIDIFYANDFIISSHLDAAEVAGFLPKGEGYKYILDGRTAFDGDKPINTNGGRTSFGHAHAASGLADVYEAVKQLQGKCGDRQVKIDADTALLRGFGGAQNLTATILQKTEK